MAIQAYQEQSPYENDDLEQTKKQTKRLRWATHRANNKDGLKKRQSILNRLHKRSPSATTDGGAAQTELKTETAAADESGISRTIYFNIPLPASDKDEEGHPVVTYTRNKIRTAKYTPLSFVPKNLWFQFHNIANIYFLFIIILCIFAIFGASNPGLNAVPLIVILALTAIKDGIEDFRRTLLDNELNNSPVHRLVNWNNVNTSDVKVSLWRRFKKANTKGIIAMWRLLKRNKKSKDGPVQAYIERAGGDRPSVDTRRASVMTERTSFQSVRDEPHVGMEMTPVNSPPGSPDRRESNAPGQGFRNSTAESPFSDVHETNGHLSVPKEKARKSIQPPARNYGNIIDNTKNTPEKAKFKKECWKDVQVGDFVRLYNEEQVPADIVVLATSDPDGACYVETKNLDGETNLKVRQALHCSRKVKRARDCERSDFWIESEAAHANLYSYNAVARWNQKDPKDPGAPTNPMAEPVGINNLLLRGCNVRNTEWVLGIVVFTGQETKIMLNAGVTPSKRAKMSRDLNWNVLYNFIILFCMCLVAAIVEGIYFGRSDTTASYFEYGTYGGSGGLDGFITFWAAIILFQNLVPISLYITLEIIRTVQAFFIYSDRHMYYAPVDYPCTPKSWNISDDLGQIEYIFSDKTGTLTQNVMEFKKATVAGVAYGEAYTEAQAGMQKRQGIDTEAEGKRVRAQIVEDKVEMIRSLREVHNNPYLVDDDLTFVAPDFVADLRNASGPAQMNANAHFMLVLALCHTVITERHPGNPPRIEFKAQSPDEAALVATARDCGFTVIGRQGDSIIVNVQGVDISYTVLNTLEFNSSRKRMSAILRMPDGKIMLFCKGADSIIYSRLQKGSQYELRKTTAEQLEMFAREGLRTLCIAQRELSEEEYQEWNKEHEIAAASVQNREDKLEQVSDSIEQELELLGGTAIEDRLQEGVPDAIALLANAGIKLWVLTGDKVETAINIGFSCNLLTNEMDLIVLRIESESLDDAEAELDKQLAKFGMTGSDEELAAAKKNHEAPAATHAVVVDGDTLKLVLDERLKQKFLLLGKQCKSVLCCRVSPSQKASVVRLVKRGLDVITLSIGDGANDVAMIQEADVGVGIAGEEGRAAVMSSDFAIGQFRFLARLTLVHGRWCYRRMAETIANFFYKNIVWTFALFWYQIYSSFDCSYVFDYSYILLFNLAFTSLPVAFMGILDQDVSDKVSLAVPELYKRGIERLEWTEVKFWTYMLDGLYQSLIVFFMPYLLFAPATFNDPGGYNVNDNRQIGVYIANAAIIVINSYILLNTYRWDWLTVLITVISILLIFAWTGIYTAFTGSFQFYKAGAEVFGTLTFWSLTLLTVIVCLLPRFTAKAFQKMFMPRLVDIVRDEVRMGKYDYLDKQDVEEMLNPPPKQAMSDSSMNSSLQNGKSPESAKPDVDRPMSAIDRPMSATDRPMSAIDRPMSAIDRPLSGDPFRSTQNSDEHEYAGDQRGAQNRISNPFTLPRSSEERPRPSYDRLRQSTGEYGKMRPSFEESRDFTSANHLMRIVSSRGGMSREEQQVEYDRQR